MALGFGDLMETTYGGTTMKVPKVKTGFDIVQEQYGDPNSFVSGLLSKYGSAGSPTGQQIMGTGHAAPGQPSSANTFGPATAPQWTNDTDRLQLVTNLLRTTPGYADQYFQAIADQGGANPLTGLTAQQIIDALNNQGFDGQPIYMTSRSLYGDFDQQGNPTGINGQPPAPGMTSLGTPMPTMGVTQGTPGSAAPGSAPVAGTAIPPGAGAAPPGGGIGTAPPPGTTGPLAPQNVEDRTVAGRLRGMLASDSPLMQEARTEGLRQANRRGLANSSIAVGASEREMIRAATPIATADANLLSTEYMQRLDLENREKLARLDDDTKRYVADLNANTQVAIKNMEVGAANQKAAQDAANNASARYTSAVINVMSNPDIPADQREAYLTHFSQVFDSDMRLIEGMYNIDLAWSSPTGGGTAAPAGWNEAAYLAANPDVAAAVQSGQFASGADHYQRFGRQEGRPLGTGGGGTAPNPSAPAAAAPSGGAAAGTQAPAGGGGGGAVPGLLTGPNAGILDQGGQPAAPEDDPNFGQPVDVQGYQADVTQTFQAAGVEPPVLNEQMLQQQPNLGAYNNAMSAIAPLYANGLPAPEMTTMLIESGFQIAGTVIGQAAAQAAAITAAEAASLSLGSTSLTSASAATGAVSLGGLAITPAILVALPALFEMVGIGKDEFGKVYNATVGFGGDQSPGGDYPANPQDGWWRRHDVPTDENGVPVHNFAAALETDFHKMIAEEGLSPNPAQPFSVAFNFTVSGDQEGDYRDGWDVNITSPVANPLMNSPEGDLGTDTGSRMVDERTVLQWTINKLYKHGFLVKA